jgi:hypothetical protein
VSGIDNPVLPVEVSFGSNASKAEGSGSAIVDRLGREGPYWLNVRVNDPSGEIVGACLAAFERSVLSGDQFLHFHCSKVVRAKPHASMSSIASQIEADQDFLRLVEAGEAELGKIEFDYFAFEDSLVTNAPDWSWAWEEFDPEHPRFLSEATARWRRVTLPYLRK